MLAWAAIGSAAVGSCDSATPPPRVASVVVTPATATLRSLGETVQLAAVARDDKGAAMADKTFTWATSDERVAALGATPTVTAVADGQATITATTDGVSGSAVIRVEQTVTTVEVTPGSNVLRSIGETVQLTAVGKDARNNAVSTSSSITWTSSAVAVAGVDSRGLVTAERDGAATVTATVNGVAGSAAVRVTQTPATLTFVAQPATSQAGVPVLAARVGVQDARGHLVASASDAVTVSLAPHALNANLSGVRTANASAGVADFSGLVVDRVGSGYALVATSGALASATSAAFEVISKPARFDSLKLSSTTLAIGGLNVPYSAWLTNASGRTLKPAGVQAWITQGTVTRAAGGASVRDCGGASGEFGPGACHFRFTILASNTTAGGGTFVPGPATARFDLSEGSAIFETLTVPVTLETFVPPPTPAARIDNVTLNSTTPSIGASVPYTAALFNASQSTVSNVFVQAYVVQGSTSRAAGGAVVSCTTELGIFPPGSCTFRFVLVVSNGTGGSGDLVPGAATARFELRWEYGLLASYTVPITIVN